MSNVIKIKRGQESQLPTLQQGELALTTDSNKLFVGGLGGNVQLNLDSTENLSLSATSEGTEVAIGISNNGSLITSTEFDVAENLADVATSGSYNDLLNKPQLEVNAYRLELTGMIPEIPANNTALKNTLSKMVSDYDNGIQSVLVVYPRGMMSSYNSSDCGIYYLRNLAISGSRGFNLENNTPSMIIQENYDDGYTEIVKKTTNLSVSCPNGSSTVSSYTINRNSEVQAKVCSIDETYIATYTPTKNSDPATKKYVDDKASNIETQIPQSIFNTLNIASWGTLTSLAFSVSGNKLVAHVSLSTDLGGNTLESEPFVMTSFTTRQSTGVLPSVIVQTENVTDTGFDITIDNTSIAADTESEADPEWGVMWIAYKMSW